jgi:multidrug efflux pump subunit AcrB
MFVIYLIVTGFGLNAFRQTPVGFIPQVDGGYLITVVQLPPGASLSRTDAVQQLALDIALQVPGVAHGVNVVGFSGATFTNAPNAGAIFITLKPFEERAMDPRQSARGIQAELSKRLAQIQDGLLFVVLPPPVRGISSSGGFRMIVEDRAGHGAAALRAVTADLMARANQTSGVTRVFTMFETSTPQIYLDIDRTKAQLLGINVQDVFNALQVYIGSVYVNDFNLFGRTYRVTAQARDENRRDVADVLKIHVRNASGDTVPLGCARHRRAVSRAARQSLSGRRARRRAGARIFARAGHRHHGPVGGRDAAGGFCRRLDLPGLPADQGRQYGDVRLRPGGGVRVPGAGRTI